MIVALAGNQNCGKTTLFNALTGSNQSVGNWPGVTIERKTGKIKDLDYDIVDLPGIYSLSPYSVEEEVSRKFVFDEKATKWLAENGYDEEFGARPLKRLIQQEVENPLAIKLLNGEIKKKY